MIKKLLVAIDASEAAAGAVAAAEQVALQVNADVVLLHVIEIASFAAADGVHRFQPTSEELRQAGNELLSRTRARMDNDLRVSLLLLEGEPADTIISTAKLCDADLIVIGTDSRGRLAHFLLGSTADSVIRRAGCPVLAVRRGVGQLDRVKACSAGVVATRCARSFG